MASSIVTLDYSRSLYFPLPHGIPLLHSTKRAEPLHRHALFAATFESGGGAPPPARRRLHAMCDSPLCAQASPGKSATLTKAGQPWLKRDAETSLMTWSKAYSDACSTATGGRAQSTKIGGFISHYRHNGTTHFHILDSLQRASHFVLQNPQTRQTQRCTRHAKHSAAST